MTVNLTNSTFGDKNTTSTDKTVRLRKWYDHESYIIVGNSLDPEARIRSKVDDLGVGIVLAKSYENFPTSKK